MSAEPLKNTLVTLYVNTAVELTQSNIEDNVLFADSDGDSDASSCADYTTEITKNGNVTWTGAVQDIRTYPKHYVLIQEVTMSEGNQSKVITSGKPSNNPNDNITHVNGSVNGNISPDPFSYSITLRVSQIGDDNQRTWNTFTIDPRLKITSQ